MKTIAIAVVIATFCCGNAIADTLCKECPPIITYPALNDSFPRTWCYSPNPQILHAWELPMYVPPDSVTGFEWEIADSPPNPINYYDPDPAGGFCGWHATTYIPMPTMSWTIACGHQEIHEPVYWRVRTHYVDGTWSNWAVAYYRVESYGEHYMPPKITSPLIASYPSSYGLIHSWDPIPGADYYEVAFANAPPHALALFDDCKYDFVRTVYGTSVILQHEMTHTPIYFLVRAVHNDVGVDKRSNWAISYYFVNPECTTATKKSSWGAIKHLFK